MGFLLFLIFLLIAFGGSVLIGALLPKKFVVEKSVELDCPPSTAWVIMTNHRRESEWRSNVIEVSRMPSRNGHAVWKETIRNQREPRIWETVVSEPSSRLVRKLVDHKKVGGQWSYELSAGKDGEDKTMLKVTQEAEVFKPLDRFKFYIFGSKHSDVNQFIFDLKQRILHMKDEE